MESNCDSRHSRLLEEALRRVRELFSEAEAGRLDCQVIVAIGFKDGVAQQVNDERKRYGGRNAD